MRKFALLALLGVSLALASRATAQPLGIGTNPQGTLVYTLGATVSKALADSAKMQSRLQPQSGTGTMVPLVNSVPVVIALPSSVVGVVLVVALAVSEPVEIAVGKFPAVPVAVAVDHSPSPD